MLIITYLLERIVESDHVGAEAGKCNVEGFPLILLAQPVWMCVVCSPGTISREGGMPPSRQSGSFPFREAPFEIFPALRSLKGSHQILVNLLINMESTADFFISPPNCSWRRETKPSLQNGFFVTELQSHNLYW